MGNTMFTISPVVIQNCNSRLRSWASKNGKTFGGSRPAEAGVGSFIVAALGLHRICSLFREGVRFPELERTTYLGLSPTDQ